VIFELKDSCGERFWKWDFGNEDCVYNENCDCDCEFLSLFYTEECIDLSFEFI